MKIGRQIDRQRERDGRAEVRDIIAPALHHPNVQIIIINKTINYSSIIQEISISNIGISNEITISLENCLNKKNFCYTFCRRISLSIRIG